MKIRFGTDGWRGLIARDFTFDNVAVNPSLPPQTFRFTPPPGADTDEPRRPQGGRA